jgi:predicted nucleic acid-binding protein
MSGKIFLDTNILVYCLDHHNTERMSACRRIIRSLAGERAGTISTQVLQEFFVASTGKLGVDPRNVKEMMKYFRQNMETVILRPELIEEAVDCSILSRLSFWDALIVVSAELARCRTILSEDLAHGATIRGVQIINPFKPVSS